MSDWTSTSSEYTLPSIQTITILLIKLPHIIGVLNISRVSSEGLMSIAIKAWIIVRALIGFFKFSCSNIIDLNTILSHYSLTFFYVSNLSVFLFIKKFHINFCPFRSSIDDICAINFYKCLAFTPCRLNFTLAKANLTPHIRVNVILPKILIHSLDVVPTKQEQCTIESLDRHCR